MAQKTGKVFVNGDEWAVSDKGFTSASEARLFAQNLASWFSGGKPGKFLVYSTNFGLTQSSFHAALKAAGHTITTNINASFTAEALLAYDAVFLAGNGADNNVLILRARQGPFGSPIASDPSAPAQGRALCGRGSRRPPREELHLLLLPSARPARGRKSPAHRSSLRPITIALTSSLPA